VCTQIGNDNFAWFGTTGSKSRLNFLDLLRAGHTDYVINDAALDYMREHALAGTLVQRLATHKRRQFADEQAWTQHLERLGIAGLAVTPDPVRVATEGGMWGTVNAHGFLCEAVVVSDDAGQSNVGQHALCWIHAERLVLPRPPCVVDQHDVRSCSSAFGPCFQSANSFGLSARKNRATLGRSQLSTFHTHH